MIPDPSDLAVLYFEPSPYQCSKCGNYFYSEEGDELLDEQDNIYCPECYLPSPVSPGRTRGQLPQVPEEDG